MMVTSKSSLPQWIDRPCPALRAHSLAETTIESSPDSTQLFTASSSSSRSVSPASSCTSLTSSTLSLTGATHVSHASPSPAPPVSLSASAPVNSPLPRQRRRAKTLAAAAMVNVSRRSAIVMNKFASAMSVPLSRVRSRSFLIRRGTKTMTAVRPDSDQENPGCGKECGNEGGRIWDQASSKDETASLRESVVQQFNGHTDLVQSQERKSIDGDDSIERRSEDDNDSLSSNYSSQSLSVFSSVGAVMLSESCDLPENHTGSIEILRPVSSGVSGVFGASDPVMVESTPTGPVMVGCAPTDPIGIPPPLPSKSISWPLERDLERDLENDLDNELENNSDKAPVQYRKTRLQVRSFAGRRKSMSPRRPSCSPPPIPLRSARMSCVCPVTSNPIPAPRTGVPGRPINVRLTVESETSLLIKFGKADVSNGDIVTRYRVEWSEAANFRPLLGETVISDLRCLEVEIRGLIPGTKYFARVCAFGPKGFGKHAVSEPPCAVPTSWRQAFPEGWQHLPKSPAEALKMAHALFPATGGFNTGKGSNRSSRKKSKASTGGAPLMGGGGASGGHGEVDSPAANRRSSGVKRGIINMFFSSLRFIRGIKKDCVGSVYFCYVRMNLRERKVLVTNEDYLPMVAMNEDALMGISCPASSYNWIVKTCTPNWSSVRERRKELERAPDNAQFQFKAHLLDTALNLQSLVGITDLGRFHSSPVIDEDSNVVFVSVFCEDVDLDRAEKVGSSKPSKAHLNPSLKWMSFDKLRKKCGIEVTSQQQGETTTASAKPQGDVVVKKLENYVSYYLGMNERLTKGLYLGLLNMRASPSMHDNIVLTPAAACNMVPYYRIRKNPHVTEPEWSWVLSTSTQPNVEPTDDGVAGFRQDMLKSIQKLAQSLDITEAKVKTYCLYHREVVEVSKDVSIILLIPPRDFAPYSVEDTEVHGSTSTSTGTRLSYIPWGLFELSHLQAYQPEIWNLFTSVHFSSEIEIALRNSTKRAASGQDTRSDGDSQGLSIAERHKQIEVIGSTVRWPHRAAHFAQQCNKPGVRLSQAVLAAAKAAAKGSGSAVRAECLDTYCVRVGALLYSCSPMSTDSTTIPVPSSSRSNISQTEKSSSSSESLTLSSFTELEMARLMREQSCDHDEGFSLSFGSGLPRFLITGQPDSDGHNSDGDFPAPVQFRLSPPSDVIQPPPGYEPVGGRGLLPEPVGGRGLLPEPCCRSPPSVSQLLAVPPVPASRTTSLLSPPSHLSPPSLLFPPSITVWVEDDECLPHGASVSLVIGPAMTVREVVGLVLQQVNRATASGSGSTSENPTPSRPCASRYRLVASQDGVDEPLEDRAVLPVPWDQRRLLICRRRGSGELHHTTSPVLPVAALRRPGTVARTSGRRERALSHPEGTTQSELLEPRTHGMVCQATTGERAGSSTSRHSFSHLGEDQV